MKKFLMVIILTIPMAATSFAQQQISASGKVVSVRMLTRTITVRDVSANEVIRYNVPMGTNVTLAGQPGRFGHLRNGDTVNVDYVNTDDGRKAVQVRVPQPRAAVDMRITEGEMSTITGRVEDINYRNRTITVRGDQSGERFTYAVPEGARTTVGGETARFGHLQRGDDVTLRFKAAGDQRKAARLRVPQTATPLAARRVPTTSADMVTQTAARTQLPRTASSLPLFGLLGMLSLILAGSLQLTRRNRRVRS